MKGADIQKILDRVEHAKHAMKSKASDGFSYSAKTSTGAEVHFSMHGLKSQVEYGHLVAALCVWTWSLKDHIKNLFTSQGLSDLEVEHAVDASPALAICSDLRNWEEHGKLEKRGKPHSRSGRFARLGEVSFIAPGDCIQALTCEAGNRFTISFTNVDRVEFSAPVLAQDGTGLGDAVAICNACLDDWEALLLKKGLGWALGARQVAT